MLSDAQNAASGQRWDWGASNRQKWTGYLTADVRSICQWHPHVQTTGDEPQKLPMAETGLLSKETVESLQVHTVILAVTGYNCEIDERCFRSPLARRALGRKTLDTGILSHQCE